VYFMAWTAVSAASSPSPATVRPSSLPSNPTLGIVIPVSKTPVEVDRDIALEAAAILGTTTLRETIDASLREIVNAKRRIEFIALLQHADRYDFGTVEDAWGDND